MDETFAQALRRLRSERGLTQEQLGNLVGYTGGYVSDLELGRRQPHHRLAARFDDVLGSAGLLAHLAADPPPPVPLLPVWDRLDPDTAVRTRPDPATAAYLAEALAVHRRAEDTIGAGAVLLPVLGQFATVEAQRADAAGDLHDQLLALEAQHAQFLGWLYQDLGDRAAAGQWYARALERATEAGDVGMVCSILSMRSNTAWEAGDPVRAVRLAESAVRVDGVTPGVLALAVQQSARAHAALGDRDAAERALDRAVDLSQRAAADVEREPPWVYFLNEQRITIQRAIAYRELGDHVRAVELFREAIGRLGAGFRRDRGAYLARLAVALVGAGEREEALVVAGEARELAEVTGSDRTLAEVRRVEVSGRPRDGGRR
jgi:tetratricopeptide (TPR) repeat protein